MSTTSTPTAPASAARPVSAETFAAIAAIVDTLFGPNARIRSVRVAPRDGESDMFLQPWALEGRRQIYASHRVR